MKKNKERKKSKYSALINVFLILFVLLITVIAVIAFYAVVIPKGTANNSVFLYNSKNEYSTEKIMHVNEDFAYKYLFKETDSGETASAVVLMSYEGKDTDVKIPEYIDCLPVTDIHNSCFSRSGIVSLTIPASITYIDNYAFYNSVKLKTIEFEDDNDWTSLTIGESAFEGCSELKSVNFIHSELNIGNEAFKHCYKLSSVKFDNKCFLTIGASCFKQCSLSNIELPKNIKSIGNYAFENCKNLKKLNIPDGCTVGESIQRQTNYVIPKTTTTKKVTTTKQTTTKKDINNNKKKNKTESVTTISNNTTTAPSTTTEPVTETTTKNNETTTRKHKWFSWFRD